MYLGEKRKIKKEKLKMLYRPSGAGGVGGAEGSLDPPPPKFFVGVPFFSKSP